MAIKTASDELLQSEEWMRFQETSGRRVVRLLDVRWSANGVAHHLPFVGDYLYVPRGPRKRTNKEAAKADGGGLGGAMKALLAKAGALGAAWVRIEPESEAALADIRESIPDAYVTKAPHDMQPKEVLRIRLAPAEKEILSGMKSKTRYNIRVAEKRGVRVVVSDEGRYADAFIGLVTGTADRKGIVPHPKAYYEAMCRVLLGENGKIFAAEKDGKIVAANLVVFYGGVATYLHGGSDDRYRADMAPYLLQWESIREAKRRGCVEYDFGGVNMEELSAGKGKWFGITRFKTGFSPEVPATVFPGAYDIVVSPLRYVAYRIVRRFKNVI